MYGGIRLRIDCNCDVFILMQTYHKLKKGAEKMKEIITTGGVSYAVENVGTGITTISFTLPDLTEDEAKAAFKNATSLTVGNETDEAYGQYPDIEFESLTVGADEEITVTMHILNETEKQIRELQASQAEQDETIAEIMFGGEVYE